MYNQEAIDIVVARIQAYQSASTTADIKQSLLLHMDSTLSNDEAYSKKRRLFVQEIASCDNAEYFVSFYSDQGRYKGSEGLRFVVLETRMDSLGKEHSDTLTSMNNLARSC